MDVIIFNVYVFNLLCCWIMKWLCFPGWAQKSGKLSSTLKGTSTEVDYNFYSTGKFPSIKDHIPDEPYSILCYSMGTLHALEASLLKKPERIVAIGGFAYFPGHGGETRMRKLLIAKMIQGLKTRPEKTLKDFYLKAGLPEWSFQGYNTVNLSLGLELLKECDMSQALERELNITLIASENDEIVPSHISQKLLEGPGQRENMSIPGNHGAWIENISEIRRILE